MVSTFVIDVDGSIRFRRYVQTTTHQTIHSKLCIALISKAFSVKSKLKVYSIMRCLLYRYNHVLSPKDSIVTQFLRDVRILPKILTYIYRPLTLYPQRDSRDISDITPRHPLRLKRRDVFFSIGTHRFFIHTKTH
jgi:hypothetical protein